MIFCSYGEQVLCSNSNTFNLLRLGLKSIFAYFFAFRIWNEENRKFKFLKIIYNSSKTLKNPLNFEVLEKRLFLSEFWSVEITFEALEKKTNVFFWLNHWPTENVHWIEYSMNALHDRIYCRIGNTFHNTLTHKHTIRLCAVLFFTPFVFAFIDENKEKRK